MPVPRRFVRPYPRARASARRRSTASQRRYRSCRGLWQGEATTDSRSKPVSTDAVAETVLRSNAGHDTVIGDAHPFAIIGERINPTGRKKLAEELKHGNYDTVKSDALAQVAAGARVLDLNAGIPGFDEVAMLSEMVKIVNDLVDIPICIDSSTPEALEAAVPLAGGKVLINSVTAEQHSCDRLPTHYHLDGAAGDRQAE